jgi:hypothetical protein
MSRTEMKSELNAKVAELQKQGLTNVEIGQAVNRDASTVSHIVRQLGLPRVIVLREPPAPFNIDERDLAWMAGVFEGEGSMHINHRSRPHRGFFASVSMAVTDKELVEPFLVWGGCVSVIHRWNGVKMYKEIYRWDLTGDKSWRMVRQLLPFFRAKRRIQMAKVYLSYMGTMCLGHRIPSPEQMVERERLYFLARELNQCGALQEWEGFPSRRLTSL